MGRKICIATGVVAGGLLVYSICNYLGNTEEVKANFDAVYIQIHNVSQAVVGSVTGGGLLAKIYDEINK